VSSSEGSPALDHKNWLQMIERGDIERVYAELAST
jgi:hypothetical protein